MFIRPSPSRDGEVTIIQSSIWGPFKLQGEKNSYIILVEISLFFLPQNNLFLFKTAIESNYFFLPSWSNPSFCIYSSYVMSSHTISLPVTLLICLRFSAYALKLGTHLAMSDSAQHSVTVYFPYSEHYTFANLALNCSRVFISQVPVLAYIIFAIKYNPWIISHELCSACSFSSHPRHMHFHFFSFSLILLTSEQSYSQSFVGSTSLAEEDKIKKKTHHTPVNTTNSYVLRVQEMKSSAGLSVSNGLPPPAHPSLLSSSLWGPMEHVCNKTPLWEGATIILHIATQ